MKNLFFLTTLLALVTTTGCMRPLGLQDQGQYLQAITPKAVVLEDGSSRKLPAAQAGDTWIVLVRHAEKEAGDDPALTPAGTERAAHLATILKAFPLDAVFTTPFQRTRQTATPAATQAGLALQEYNPRDLPGFATTLRETWQGKSILVSGHSNTTPTLANALLGTEQFAAFAETDYDNFLLIRINPAGEASVWPLKYR